MRTILVVVLLSLAAAITRAEGPVQRTPRMHVRPLSPAAADLIADALRRSSIVAALADDLEQTDVVVFVSQGIASGFPHAYMAFIGCGAGVRYLLVRIDPWRAPPPVRIAWLAHELQHALEVARAPEVRDEEGVGRLYRRIGWESSKGRFESDAALAVGQRVTEQLARPGRRIGHE